MPFTEWVGHALGGPGHLRFIIQPTIALLLGLRDGRRDFRDGEEPFIWGLLHGRAHLKQALRKIAVPLCLAIVFDAILQFYTLRTVRVGWALVVGIFLVAIPYLAVRALTNRISGAVGHRRAPPHAV